MLIGVALAVAGVALAVTRPRLLLTVMVVMDVTNLTGVIEEHAGISPFRPLLVLALISVLVLARQGRLVVSGSPIVITLMLLLGCVWVNAALSTIPATSAAAAVTFTTNIIYFLIVYILLCSLKSWAEVLAATTVGLAVLAAVGVGHELVLGGAGDLFGLSRIGMVEEGAATIPRHSGTVEDVNFWGRLLLLYLPAALSFAVVAGRRGSYARLGGWVVVAGSLTAGVYLTQSRGAFLALPIALFAWIALAGWQVRKALLWMPAIILVLVTVSGAWDRLTGLIQFVSSGLQTSGDLSLTNRLRLMQNAGRMFMDSPWTGQGIGTYPERVVIFDRYANTAAPLEVAGAAHNFYLEQAADGGVMLLTAWLLVAGAVVLVCWRSLRLLGATELTNRYVVVGGASGLVAWLAASLFIHLSNFRALLVVIAVLAALEQDVRRKTPRETSARQARANPRRLLAAALATSSAVLIIATGLGLLANGWATTYRSAVLLTIGLEDNSGGYAAYQLDLIGRGLVAPSFAEVLQREFDAQPPGPYQATFRPSREGGGIVVQVRAESEVKAQAAAEATVIWATDRVAALGTPYELRAGPSVPAPIGGMSWRHLLLLTLGLCCGLGAALLYRRTEHEVSPATLEPMPADASAALDRGNS